MDDKTALHTAARRFCQSRFSEWTGKYSLLPQRIVGDYSKEAYALFPRYRLDSQIQTEVERLVPNTLASIFDMREALLAACGIAFAKLHVELNDKAQAALEAERDDFHAYIKGLFLADLFGIEPLPYRRVLSTHEAKEIWELVKSRWNVGDGYWYPLKPEPAPNNLICLHKEYWQLKNGAQVLQSVLNQRGILTVLEMNEFGDPDYEEDVSLCVPKYRLSETYYTSRQHDWLVYASHESSITLAGEWLVQHISDIWPDWSEHIYGGPFHTDDLRGSWNWEG